MRCCDSSNYSWLYWVCYTLLNGSIEIRALIDSLLTFCLRFAFRLISDEGSWGGSYSFIWILLNNMKIVRTTFHNVGFCVKLCLRKGSNQDTSWGSTWVSLQWLVLVHRYCSMGGEWRWLNERCIDCCEIRHVTPEQIHMRIARNRWPSWSAIMELRYGPLNWHSECH